jgi:hypothetical protein
MIKFSVSSKREEDPQAMGTLLEGKHIRNKCRHLSIFCAVIAFFLALSEFFFYILILFSYLSHREATGGHDDP